MRKEGDDLLSKSERAFSQTQAKFSMKSFPADVLIVTNEGKLVDVASSNDTFRDFECAHLSNYC